MEVYRYSIGILSPWGKITVGHINCLVFCDRRWLPVVQHPLFESTREYGVYLNDSFDGLFESVRAKSNEWYRLAKMDILLGVPVNLVSCSARFNWNITYLGLLVKGGRSFRAIAPWILSTTSSAFATPLPSYISRHVVGCSYFMTLMFCCRCSFYLSMSVSSAQVYLMILFAYLHEHRQLVAAIISLRSFHCDLFKLFAWTFVSTSVLKIYL